MSEQKQKKNKEAPSPLTTIAITVAIEGVRHSRANRTIQLGWTHFWGLRRGRNEPAMRWHSQPQLVLRKPNARKGILQNQPYFRSWSARSPTRARGEVS
jgi:hypothetical protein